VWWGFTDSSWIYNIAHFFGISGFWDILSLAWLGRGQELLRFVLCLTPSRYLWITRSTTVQLWERLYRVDLCGQWFFGWDIDLEQTDIQGLTDLPAHLPRVTTKFNTGQHLEKSNKKVVLVITKTGDILRETKITPFLPAYKKRESSILRHLMREIHSTIHFPSSLTKLK